MQELDLVVLTKDLPAHGLQAGDIGTIVYVPEKVDSFEVEFVRADGQTIAVVSLITSDIRPFDGAEILQARPVV